MIQPDYLITYIGFPSISVSFRWLKQSLMAQGEFFSGSLILKHSSSVKIF